MIARFIARYRGSLGQLLKFGIVGMSGVVVNLVVAYAAKKIAPAIWSSAHEANVWFDLPWTDYNIRWYHVFSMLAFVVANLCNYQFNRMWSFRSKHHAGWLRELIPFFTVGLFAQGVGMVVETALMHETLPIGLPDSIFDGSTGFRTKWYWAHLIMICVTLPISFLANKFWTFKAIRRGESTPPDEAGVVEDPAIQDRTE